MVRHFRFAGDGYFWIHDTGLHMVMHPIKPALDTTDVSGIKAPNGLYLFQEMGEVIQGADHGFVNYAWPKPGQENPSPKVSHVRLFKPWGWVVGTGVYVDDIMAATLQIALKFLAGLSILGILIIAVAVTISQDKQELAKGFQQLATHSTDATGEIAETLGQLRNDITNSSNALQAIIGSVAKIARNVQDISAALEQQSAASTEISQTLENFNRQMDDFFVRIGSTTEASHGIHDITGTLKDSISRFRL